MVVPEARRGPATRLRQPGHAVLAEQQAAGAAGADVARGRANSGVTTVAAVAEQPGDTARPTVATGRCAVLAGAASIGADPAPVNIRNELISGGNTE